MMGVYNRHHLVFCITSKFIANATISSGTKDARLHMTTMIEKVTGFPDDNRFDQLNGVIRIHLFTASVLQELILF